MPRMAGFSIVLCALLSVARAEDVDPPSFVGRLSVIEGTSSLYAPGEATWSAATINYPVTSGLWLWNPANARSEVQLGANAVRLGQASELGVVALDESEVRLHLATGELSVRLGAVPEGGFRVETPGGTATLREPGWYHLEAGPPQGGMPGRSGALAVLAGSAEFGGPFATVALAPGQRADSDGSGEAPEISAAVPTDLDAWEPRDERGTAMAETLRYVSPDMTGYQDLETQGHWETMPDYGPVWYPTVAIADWAPYRYGRWRYVAPWGWTWIDDAPWGFAPFHYGRWVRIGLRWAWTPGAFERRPVYAPALVSFFDTDDTDGPSIGWVPLGPRERFRPFYRASERYRERFARGEHDEQRRDERRHDDERGAGAALGLANAHAATAVPRTIFSRGLSVQAARRAPAPERIRDAGNPRVVEELRPSGELRGARQRFGMPPVVTPGEPSGVETRRPREHASRREQPGDSRWPQGVGPQSAPPHATPPAVQATPPAVQATPPAVRATPPAVQATPPAVQATPPALQTRPPSAAVPERNRRHERPARGERDPMPPRREREAVERPRVFTHPNAAVPERAPAPVQPAAPAPAAPSAVAPPGRQPQPAEHRGGGRGRDDARDKRAGDGR
ncbi:MAG: hypothetical protein HY943_01440 [Gammaproteobacteria bacterium]|nr:hypothetical protein [Gammaproteobacteria bacterium]